MQLDDFFDNGESSACTLIFVLGAVNLVKALPDVFQFVSGDAEPAIFDTNVNATLSGGGFYADGRAIVGKLAGIAEQLCYSYGQVFLVAEEQRQRRMNVFREGVLFLTDLFYPFNGIVNNALDVADGAFTPVIGLGGGVSFQFNQQDKVFDQVTQAICTGADAVQIRFKIILAKP